MDCIALASITHTHHSSLTTHPYCQSGSSGCFRSHNGRRLWTVGITSKLYVGGGDGVDHSSVQAFQGSSPAGWPYRSEANRLYRNTTKLADWMTAPTVVN